MQSVCVCKIYCSVVFNAECNYIAITLQIITTCTILLAIEKLTSMLKSHALCN